MPIEKWNNKSYIETDQESTLDQSSTTPFPDNTNFNTSTEYLDSFDNEPQF